MSQVLLRKDFGPVRVLTLNRPEARNALSGELIVALYEALLAVDADDNIGALVLTGSDPAFCAGVDLKAAAQEGEAYFSRFTDSDCIGQVALVTKPVVGAINGATFTGGLELALGCDFLVASERALFADTHARVGVLPGGGMTARLPHLVGVAQARRMSMTGEIVDAARAESVGLVTEVVEHGWLVERAVELAAQAAAVPARVLLPLKQMYSAGWSAVYGPALDVEARVAAASPPDYAQLEANRVAVMARNRSALDSRPRQR